LNAPPKKTVNHPIIGGHLSATAPAAQRILRDGGNALDSVLESLTGDVVVMGGYRGSILRSAKAPHRRLWVPVKVGLKIRKVNMEVGLDPKDEEEMENHIFASGMLQNIGPVDISRRLFKKLRECENARTGRLRVHDYGYDWRLSPHLLSRKLAAFLKTLPSNQPGVPAANRGALVIAHSLGGLITRHVVNQHPELFSGVVFAGTPQRCINVLGPLRNGDAVLLNEKVLTAQVNLTLRTTFAFLPEDGFCFIDKITKEQYPVDFYNVYDWVKYRLSPCVSGPALPPLSRSSSAFGTLLSLSESLPGLPIRGRSNSHQHKKPEPGIDLTQERNSQVVAAVFSAGSVPPIPNNTPLGQTTSDPSLAQQARFLSYLRRTLAEIKQFRAELTHDPKHQEANRYPPFAVIYGKDVPTVYAAREGIACADAYDDLVFRGGDGVVLAREAMLPVGYELVREGRVCTDRGHVSMLGDLNAVGRAVGAVVRGRRKGIGMGTQ
jgi:pimeloyl-ACP methyl ester carboxylesterase